MKDSEILSRNYYPVTGNLKLKGGACQEDLLHLELRWNIPNSPLIEMLNSYDFENSVMYS